MVQVSFDKTITVQFPNIDGSEVTIKDNISGGEFIEMQKASEDNPINFIFTALERLIVDWNLTDNGEKLPITKENLMKFDLFDLKDLFSKTKAGQRLEEMEKKS